MEEMRRVDIVYFLSRKGSIEHPHLIRLHHLSRHGIRLRDVKRWLGEVRGKDMPDSFSWSYKRRYKTGYVWQDLLDDDLITPISDSEYVLKGSEISSSTVKPPDFSYTEKKDRPSSPQEAQKALHKNHNSSDSVSAKSSPEIEESSPTFGSETSTVLTDDSIKLEMNSTPSASAATKQEQWLQPSLNDEQKEPSSPSCSANQDKKTGKKSRVNEAKSKKGGSSSSSSSSSSSIFLNLITCGGMHTNDSAVVPMNKQKKPFSNVCSSDPREIHSPLSAEICKRDSFGGSQSQRVFGTPNWAQYQSSGRKSFDAVRHDLSRVAYKPVIGPTCSQCGKPFRPEKMHSHMKSCKGMKAAMSKATNEKASSSEVSVEFKNRGSFSGQLLAH